MHLLPPHARPWIYGGTIALAVLAAYANSFDVPFQFDDERNIVSHGAIRSLTVQPEDGPNLHYRRPVGRWTLWLNYTLHRLDVRGYHVFNVAVHVAAALVLFGLIRRTLRLPRFASRYADLTDELALAVALVWALHPLQVQSVTYIIQRFESLMGLFFLLSLYCLVRSVEDTSTVASPRQRRVSRVLWQLSCIAAAALSLGSKEVGAMIPIVAVLFDRVFLASSWSELLRRRGWVYAGMVPALVWFATCMTPEAGQFAATAKGVTPWEYLRSQPGVIVHYLRLAAWPDSLVLDYGWPIAHSWQAIYLPGAVIVALLGASFVACWKRPALGFLAISFFLILAPTSSIVPIVDLAFEHRMYLALVPLAVLVVLSVNAALQHASIRAFDPRSIRACSMVLLALVTVALASRTYLRNSDWRDKLILWEKNAAAAPVSYRAWGNLALGYLDRGRTSDALAAAERAVALKPQSATVLGIQGTVLLAADRPEESLAAYRQAVEFAPDSPQTQCGLAKCYEKLKRLDEAERHYQLAIAAGDKLADPHDALARLLSERNEDAEAIAHYREACRLAPEDSLFPTNFGTFYARRGRHDLAIAQFSEALRRQPNYAQAQLQLALAQYDRGDLPAASQAAVKLLRLRPDSVAARQLLQQIDERSGG